MSLGIIEPPLALFIAAVPVFKVLTNSHFPIGVRAIGEILEGAAKPVGSDAEGVIELEDQDPTPPVRPGLSTSSRKRRD